LFVSACATVNDDFADAIMREHGCLSIVGPAQDIGFSQAAVMWAAFYHLMFERNPKAMNSTVMAGVLADLERTFDVELTC
jgi:hypothetical protein